MGRVNWEEAKRFYVNSSKYSYSLLAARYEVSKATIQKRGTKERWKRLRDEREREELKRSTLSVLKNKEKMDERHLKQYETIEAMGYTMLIRAHNNMLLYKNDDKVYKKQVQSVLAAVRMLDVGMKGCREVLGLRNNFQERIKVDQNGLPLDDNERPSGGMDLRTFLDDVNARLASSKIKDDPYYK